ncbi:MAG: hypothetical protein IJR63_04560 [Synergistaceae bacterium]|nr:hypothetical protein [Synergistaceae bacterium]
MKRIIILSLAAVLCSSAAFAGYQTFHNLSLYVPDGWSVERSGSSYAEMYDPDYPATGRIYVELGSKQGYTLGEIAEQLRYDYRGSNLTARDYYYDFVYTDSSGLIWDARVFDYNVESSFPSDTYCLILYTEYVSEADFSTVYDSVRYTSGGGGGGGSSGGCSYGAFQFSALLLGFAFLRRK